MSYETPVSALRPGDTILIYNSRRLAPREVRIQAVLSGAIVVLKTTGGIVKLPAGTIVHTPVPLRNRP